MSCFRNFANLGSFLPELADYSDYAALPEKTQWAVFSREVASSSYMDGVCLNYKAQDTQFHKITSGHVKYELLDRALKKIETCRWI